MSLVASIDAWLPQTQCTRCGYPDCRAYAVALAEGRTAIDRCPPGGNATRRALAALLGVADPGGLAADLAPFAGFETARIREHECIGCTKCIDACPVDAIVGSGKRMHTVIESLCTGCELCLPPCPVDCIDLVPAPASRDPSPAWPGFPRDAAERFRAARDRRRARDGQDRPTARQRVQAPGAAANGGDDRMKQEILDAVARSRARRHCSHREGAPRWNRKPST